MRDDSVTHDSSLIPHPSSLYSIALVFLLARIAILLVRPPFFDELFTLWMARQPVSHIVPNLLHDSGPPLYYFLARFPSITALRLLSLLFATLQFVIIARRSRLAALLLALYPPAALSAVDARAYALCALFVTIGVLAWDSERSLLAAFSMALAAHTHYYGVLFFPLLLIRRGRRTAQAVISFLLAVLLFLPGLLLAMRQPIEAMQWNREPLFAPLANLSTAGTYAYSLFAGAPIAVAVVALLVLAAAVSRSMRFAPAVLIPVALLFAFAIAGRAVYFPMRFEAVIAGPLVLWAGHSLSLWPVSWRTTFAVPLLLIGFFSIAIGVIDHRRRPVDPYREAALVLKRHATSEPVVASGYCYLEAVAALDRPVMAWPAEQAIHPGWRATEVPDVTALPRSPFVWIGERQAPELLLLRGVKTVQPLFWNERALVANATNLTAPVH